MYAKSKGEKMFRSEDSSEIEKLRQQRNALTEEYNTIRQRRKELVDRLKPTQRGEMLEYVHNKVLQFEISQLQSEKIQKSRKTTELEAQRIEVNLLLDQLKQREKIIVQQNEMLGRDETSRQYQSFTEEEPRTPVGRKDEEWFYSFLESLESKDPTKLLPTINRLKSSSHHTKPLETHNGLDPATDEKLPQFKRIEQRPILNLRRRQRSRSIKQKSTSKDEAVELSRNEYSEFL